MASTHPIVALWSHPRSMSTAVERVMRERGDFRCYHEPFMYLYYVGEGKRAMPRFNRDTAQPTSYAGIREMLLEQSTRSPVFFKDMSYYILEHMLDDPAFARRLRNTFLIRDPARSIVSYYRLDTAVTCEEIGLEAQCLHHRWLSELLGLAPTVIDASDIQADAPGMMRAYCEAVGVAFLSGSLQWRAQPPEAWKAVAGWHGEVSASEGIRPAGQDPGKATVTLDSAAHLRRYYAHHLPFYEELYAGRLRPL